MFDKDYFANCAAIGISPQVAETVPHGLKKYLGRVGYLSWAALQYAKFRPFELTIEDAGVRRSVDVVEMRISNGGFHGRSEEHTSELQSLMRISYAVFCLKKKKTNE